MKKTITIILCVITLSAFADSVTVVKDTSALTWSKVYQDAKDGISGLAKALKVPAEFVYTTLVKQQIVYSIVYLLTILAGVLLAFACGSQIKEWRKRYLAFQEKDKYGDFFSPVIVTSILFGIGAIICITTGITHLDVVVTGFVNPNYGAIKEIMSFVR